MATLPQRFKLLATRCAVAAPSPSRSPAPPFAASPGYRLRSRSKRRSSLRRLLSRAPSRRRHAPAEPASPPEEKKSLISHTLRDLFVASPEAAHHVAGGGDEVDAGRIRGGAGAGGWRFGPGGLRSLLMRRSWRPVLGAIPEGEGKIELDVIEE